MPATLDLRFPSVEDHGIQTFTVSRRSAGGQPRQSRDVGAFTGWPRLDIFDWTFQNLSGKQRAELETFICENVGQSVTIDDHTGDRWVGIIIGEPTFQQTRPGVNADGSDCDTDEDGSTWDISFEFQGVHE
jgi:hypothetical protein